MNNNGSENSFVNIDEVEEALGLIRRRSEQFAVDVVEKLSKSKDYKEMYIQLYRLHYHSEDVCFQKRFLLKDEVKKDYRKVYRLINFLKEYKLIVCTSNPNKKRDRFRKVGLREPDIHHDIIKKLLKVVKKNET